MTPIRCLPAPIARLCCQFTVAVLLGFAAAGCGGPKTYPIQGRVVYAPDNAPATDLEKYSITANCQEARVSAVGTIDGEGRFELSTFTEGDGAIAGEYRVAITPPVAEGDEDVGLARIDIRYQDPSTSGLSFKVPLESDEGAVLVIEPLKKAR